MFKNSSEVVYKVIFLGTPAFAVPCLERLLEGPYSIEAVFTQPDRPSGRGRKLTPAPVKEYAGARGLRVFQPETLRTEEIARQFTALNADVAVVAAYGKMIPSDILSLPRCGCVNLHPSLLPSYRGASPVASSILSGDSRTGVTVMLLDEGMDSGPVLARREEDILDNDTGGTLTARLAERGADLLAEVLPLWLEGRVEPQPQDESKAVYTEMLTKQDGLVDWRRTATELARQVRALSPWPGSFTYWQNKQLKILEAVPVEGGRSRPGYVTGLPSTAPAPVGVETSEGILALTRIQLEGKKEVTIQEFILGQRSFTDSTLA